ncbi:MAG TPA: hypothetical protein VGK86_04890 [Thermoanaerobaculia bacterium]|jgi:hypothetical protein
MVGRIALVGPTTAVARSFEARLAPRFPESRVLPVSLTRFLSDRRAPTRVVLCPAGLGLADDLAFLADSRRRALWPAPGADLFRAIAGLRGSHDEPPVGAMPSAATRSGRRTALLLEGDVTSERARGAASSAAPRQWIAERVQRVRIEEPLLEELRRLGIRWSVLEPVEVVGLAASLSLARARRRWARLLPSSVPVWVIPAGSKFEVRGSK